MNRVYDKNLYRYIDFNAAVEQMDDEIRKECEAREYESEQAFYDGYCRRHEEKYGKKFKPKTLD